ncbi:MAG: hypothetical protein HRU15_18980 [Planctomycetes bacterium]|nr:hypothetical protein [Planctomycetota bacterium]
MNDDPKNHQATIEHLTELLNIGICKAASSLNEMINDHVQLEAISVHIDHDSGFHDAVEDKQSTEGTEGNVIVVISQLYNGSLSGMSQLALTIRSANILCMLMMDDPIPETDIFLPTHERESAMVELGNILINTIIGSLVNSLSATVSFALPQYQEITKEMFSQQEYSDADVKLITSMNFNLKSFTVQGQLIHYTTRKSLATINKHTERLLSEDQQ